MQDNKFQSLVLDKYASLLHCMLPAAHGFAICDAKGVPQFISDSAGKGDMEDAVAFLNTQPAALLDENGEILSRRMGGNRTLHGMSLLLDSLETYGFIAVLVDQPQGEGEGVGPVAEALQSIAACLTSE